jgi:superfamily II DNA/RNA helicase
MAPPHRRRIGSTSVLTDSVPFPETLPAPADMPEHAEQPQPAPEALPALARALEMVAAEPAESVPATDEGDTASDEASSEPRGFAALGLSEPILRAIAEMGYLAPTPIQQQAIPAVLMGRDVLGVAQTGTGKTAGFTLPMLDILSGSRARARMPRSLILEPTRELALQVAENFVMYGKYLKLTHALIIGGESMSDQKDLLMRGVDVLIATPGRLIDMFERGGMLLTDARLLVIDETDRMLDMGFIPDVERIVAMLPANRQTLFFSATMAPEIRRLADAFLKNPKTISVSRPATVATTITQRYTLVAEHDKREALRRLIRSEDVRNALIFCNRKRDVDILHKSLTRHGFSVGALHGDMAQPVRFATLDKFKAGELRLLCCSDVAARGLDIGGLSHVFNFDVPIHAEDYVHRSGRTGRAGMEGRTFMLATPDDRQAVEAIQNLTGAPIERMQIEGLDTAEWTEGDGRKRRGRGKPAAKGKSADKRAEPRREAKAGSADAPKAEPPRAEPRRAAEPRKSEPRRASPRKAEPAVAAEPMPSPPRPERSEPIRAETSARPERDDRSDRFPRRDPRRRDDDLGPSVVGFGEDVPAFMLVAARPRRAGVHRMEEGEAEA